MLFLDLRDNIGSEILVGHAGAEFMPFSSSRKALGLALEPILGLSAALGLGNSRNSAMTRQHMLGLELLLYNIQRLPTKLTTSPSPRAGDKLLSEWRISSSLFLKSTEQFLKAQIYIL